MDTTTREPDKYITRDPLPIIRGQFITSLENGYPIVLRNRDRGHKHEL